MDLIDSIIKNVMPPPDKAEFLRFKKMFSYELREFFARFKGDPTIPQSAISTFLRERNYGTFHVVFDHGREFHVMSTFNTKGWNLSDFLKTVRPEFKLGAPDRGFQ